jgi:hypothetical protein
VSDPLSEAEESLLADDCFDFIQGMALRGFRYLIVRIDPGPPHVHLGKSSLPDASLALRECADRIDSEYTVPESATKN